MGKTIKTKAPAKGDLVVGHGVAAFFVGLPCVLGTVSEVSKSGHRVVVDFGDTGRLFLRCRHRAFTWRRSAEAYQDENARARQGDGLALTIGGRR